MSKLETISAKDKNLSQLFKEFYFVPDYQREYVWGAEPSDESISETDDFEFEEDPVYRLIDDVYRAWKSQRTVEYFIGAIIVTRITDKINYDKFELIDGQQRMTTLTVILLAMRDLISKYGNVPDGLKTLIHGSKTDEETGLDVYSLRLELQYEDAGGILHKLHSRNDDEEPIDTIEATSSSSQNILNAYNKSKHYLGTVFKDDAEALQRFFAFVSHKLKVVQIETPGREKALEIFETINQRGVGLTPMDLLKNLMFVNANYDEFSEIKLLWKKLIATIEVASKADRDNPMRFLRYFFNADYVMLKDGIAREKDIYSKFKTYKHQMGYQDDPKSFVITLTAAATAYKNLRWGKAPSGSNCLPLFNLAELGKGTFKQHYPLLLSARGLDEELYEKFAGIVERAVTVSFIAGAEPNAQERALFELTILARGIEDAEDLAKFEEETEAKMITPYVSGFVRSMKFMSERSLGPKYRTRYVLGRIAGYIQTQSKVSDQESLEQLRLKTKNVEHILPQDGERAAYEEFSNANLSDADIKELKTEHVEKLGNLTVLSEESNKSAGGRPFSQKKSFYEVDEWLISKFMVSEPLSQQGRSQRFYSKNLMPFNDWNLNKMEQRQEMLTNLALQIWKLPPQTKYPAWNENDDES